MYNIIFVSDIQHSDTVFFIDYTPLKVIIKYNLDSLCCTIYPCSLFTYFIHGSLYQYLFFKKFIYFWLHWVFVAVCGLPLVVVSRSYSSLQCVDFSFRWLLLWQSMGSRTGLQQLVQEGSVVVVCGLESAGSVVVAHGLSCSEACGIFPDQGSNPCPLHWQADS